MYNAESTPSPGERRLFDLLTRSQGADNWVVLHSQRLRQVKGKTQGEADFVVMVPGLGILVLEVKASRRIIRQDGKWYSGQRMEPMTDPFDQVNRAKHAIREVLGEPLSRSVFISDAVVFTDVDQLPDSSEWRPDQVIDARSMTPDGLVASIEASLRNSANHFLRSIGKTRSSGFTALSEKAMKEAFAILRPDFEVGLSFKVRRQQTEEELVRFTSEQFGALDAMRSNPRVVFEGPAGTGKTFMAVEAARRALDDGDRVLFVCRNVGLADYLSVTLASHSASDCLFVGTFHSYLMRLSDLRPTVGTDVRSFFDSVLPDAALEILTGPKAERTANGTLRSFDCLIIDELQDLVSTDHLAILASLLDPREGHPGRFLAFGDPANQAFFEDRPVSQVRQEINAHFGSYASYTLLDNCRNTRRMVDMVEAAVHLDPRYRSVRRSDDGHEPTTHYVNEADGSTTLARALERLNTAGYANSDIVVLSMRREEDALATKVRDPRWRGRLSTHRKPLSPDDVRCASVYQFKGLESPVVVLTDVSLETLGGRREPLYVGLTRATERLVILVERSAQAAFVNMLIGGGDREGRPR